VKPIHILLPLLAILFGFGGGTYADSPFEFTIWQSEKTYHFKEAQQGQRSVRDWKRSQMIDAITAPKPYYFGERDAIIVPEQCLRLRSMFCDFRN